MVKLGLRRGDTGARAGPYAGLRAGANAGAKAGAKAGLRAGAKAGAKAGANAGAPRNPALAAATQAATRITYLNMADCCFGFGRIETDTEQTLAGAFYTPFLPVSEARLTGVRPFRNINSRSLSALSLSQLIE